MTPVVRPITPGDWPGIIDLEARAYADSGLSETPAALSSRAGSGTSFVLDLRGRVAGYLLSLPYPRFRCPDLGRAEDTAHVSRNLHLHDILVAADLRRAGLGSRLLRTLLAVAPSQAYERISLVAVGGSRPFWTARGFVPDGAADVSAYGPDATYLSRTLS